MVRPKECLGQWRLWCCPADADVVTNGFPATPNAPESARNAKVRIGIARNCTSERNKLCKKLTEKRIECRVNENRRQRVDSLEAALMSGWCSSDEHRRVSSQFQEKFQSGEFANSGLKKAAESIRLNFGRLKSLCDFPTSFFDYGRQWQREHTRLCVQFGLDPDIPFHTECDTENLDKRMSVLNGLSSWMYSGRSKKVLSNRELGGFAAGSIENSSQEGIRS